MVFILKENDQKNEVKKLNLEIFTHAPQAKLSSKLLSSSTRQREIIHPPRQCFLKIYSPQQKGGMEGTMMLITEAW